MATSTKEETESSKLNIFDSDDDDEEEGGRTKDDKTNKTSNNIDKNAKITGVKINKKYAQEFEHRKQREELRQVRFNDGASDNDDNSSSSSEEEDEEAELLTDQLDVDILKTINAVRSKDARIYDSTIRFFQPEDTSNDDEIDNDDDNDDDTGDEPIRQTAAAAATEKASKPKRYKDVLREQILEQMDKDDNNNEDNEEEDETCDPRDRRLSNMPSSSSHHSHSRLAYDATQLELRQAFLDSTNETKNSNNEHVIDDDDEIIVLKDRTQIRDSNKEQTQEELKMELERLKASTAKDGSNSQLVDPKGEIADGQAFLIDFFQTRPWLEKKDDDEDDDDEENGHADEDFKPAAKRRTGTAATTEDDDDASLQDLEHADDFESAFNFRFEQVASALGVTPSSGTEYSNISYARGQAIPTLRRPDDTRKDKRLARMERKAAERTAKEEQLKRLKNAKRQEMNSKLRQIQAVLGQSVAATEDNNNEDMVDEATIMKLLEGDFDPDKFEELMQQTYNDDFYEKSDAEWTSDKAVRESLHQQQQQYDDENDDNLVGQDDADGGLYDNYDEDPENENGNGDYEEEDEEEDWQDEFAGEDDGGDEEDNALGRKETAIERKIKAKMEEELYKLDYEDIVAGMPTRFKYRQVEANSYGLSTAEILGARDSTLKQFVSLKKLAPYSELEYFVGSKKRRRFREIVKQELEEETNKSAENATPTDEAEAMEGEIVDESIKKKSRRRLKKGSKQKKESDTADNKETRSVEEANDPVLQEEGAVEPKKKSTNPHVSNSPTSSQQKDEIPLIVKGTNKEDPPPLQKPRSSLSKNCKHKIVKKKRSSTTIAGVSQARLSSYGL